MLEKVVLKKRKILLEKEKAFYICIRLGEMAEWSNAAVLKTVDCNRSGGSNPSFSAKPVTIVTGFLFLYGFEKLNL